MTASSPPALGLSDRRSRQHAYLAVGLYLLCTVTAAFYVASPDGTGRTVFFVVRNAVILLGGFGPWLRGVRPNPLWVALSAAAVLDVVASVAWASTGGDPWLWLPRTAFLSSVALIAIATVTARDRRLRQDLWSVDLALDMAAATTTITLLLLVIPVVRAHDVPLPEVLRWCAFPLMDTIVLVLMVHRSRNLGGDGVTWRWWTVGFVLLTVGDLTFAYVGLLLTPSWVIVPRIIVLFAATTISLGSLHPSVLWSLSPRAGTARHSRSWYTVMFYLVAIPGLATLALPSSTPVSRWVRTGLLLVLLALVFVRLVGTMKRLHGAEEESRHRAARDPLTGLLNRSGMLDLAPDRIRRAHEEGRHIVLLFADCDHFKQVNDTWGHPAGDVLLRTVADRLTACVTAAGPDALVARHGGDEFVALVTVDGPKEAVALADRVVAELERPTDLRPGLAHASTPSVGVALARPDEVVDIEVLLTRADIALYAAKERGRDRHAFYDDDLGLRNTRRVRVSEAVRRAVEEKRFGVHLQPLVALDADHTLLGWEALARWDDPDLGVVPPDVFIPLAEESGLIERLGLQVLHDSLDALTRLRAVPGLEHTHVSVNVSVAQLEGDRFADDVALALVDHGLPPEALWLEVTESMPLEPDSTALATLERIRSRGVRFSIDDFGTGYSSVTALLRRPCDAVKIDRSLIGRIGEDPAAPDQVRAVVELVTTLGIDTVVAEGVETEEQAAQVSAAGCTVAQGWLFGRPGPAHDVVARWGHVDA